MTQKKKPNKNDLKRHLPDPEELARKLASKANCWVEWYNNYHMK